MQKAEVQHANVQKQSAAKQAGGSALATVQSEDVAQLEAMMNASPATSANPAMAAQRRMMAVVANAQQPVLQRMADLIHNRPQQQAAQNYSDRINHSPMMVAQRQRHERLFGMAQRVEDEEALQGKFASRMPAQLEQQTEAKPNNTGLPDNLKAGIENLSGMSMDNVKVHYNSSQPAQLNALAYAQGTDIHVAPGQEQHLPHEAWHVAQQAQGRVQPTMQMKGGVPVNDDAGLEREADLMGSEAAIQRAPKFIGTNAIAPIEPAKSVAQLANIDINASDKTGDDWYVGKNPNSLSSTTKAKKKYQQLLYAFFELNDESQLAEQVRALDLNTVTGDFLSSMISMHKHIAPFDSSGGQGFDRSGQSTGNYVRSDTTHPFNKLHKELLDLKGYVPGDWMQPLNRVVLEAQAHTSGQKNVDKLVPRHTDGSQSFDTSVGRVSAPSAGLPKNNMNLLREAQEIAKVQDLPDTYFTKGKVEGADHTGIINGPAIQELNGKTIAGQGKAFVAEKPNSTYWSDEIAANRMQRQIDINNKKAVLRQGHNTITTKEGGFSLQGTINPIYQNEQLKFIYIEGQANATMTNLTTTVQQDQRDNAKKLLFDVTADQDIKESRGIQDPDEYLAALEGPSFQDKIKSGHNDGNVHDKFLAERGKVMNAIENAISSKGVNGVSVVGSEDHPSLILHIPQRKVQQNVTVYYGDKQETKANQANTEALLVHIVDDFNKGANGWDVKVSRRGSFGFQRPTLADTGDSIRFWPGYAPIESLTGGLSRILEKIEEGERRAAGQQPLQQPTDFNLGSVKSDFQNPLSYMEALKTAMRHAHIALQATQPQGLIPGGQKKVATWLKTRMLIKLKQSETLLKQGDLLVAAEKKQQGSVALEDLNKNYQMTADMVDKLQEYSFMYTAAMMAPATQNPNQDVNIPEKFKDDDDAYEKHLKKELSGIRGDHRVFYLDSGEQALVMAGILANRFQQQKDAQAVDVQKSDYQDLNSYFEIGVFGGANRSNLNKTPGGKIVHADLSPVITSGVRKSKADIKKDIKATWQDQGGAVAQGKNDVIPILDITNSSLASIASLGNMPDNYIVVESLTKHQQLGADKFIMGRLIAVSKTEGTKQNQGTLSRTNFLDLAQQVVGSAANEAYNPLLHALRKQSDKALYEKTDPNRFALVLHPTLSRPQQEPQQENQLVPEIDFSRLQLMVPLNSFYLASLPRNPSHGDMWERILMKLTSEALSSIPQQGSNEPKIEDVD